MDSSFWGSYKHLLTSYPIDDSTLVVSDQNLLSYVHADGPGRRGGGYVNVQHAIPVPPA